MHDLQAVPGLVVARVQDDRDLKAMIAVRRAADPARPAPRLENLRHNLASSETLVYLVASVDGDPVACGFVDPWPERHAEAHLLVVPGARRRGIGSALLAELGTHALAAGKPELEGEVRESDTDALAYFERRGYRVVGGEQAVALELDGVELPASEPPPGVEIVSRAQRPDVAEALYPISRECVADIPGVEEPPTYEQFRAYDLDRPTRIPELFFVALHDGEPIGYASMDAYGDEAQHGLTAVARAWRRRGVATALKHAQIRAAKEAGFRRLITGSEERNTPMRSLNAKLGYRPDPSRSTVIVRGPADVR